MKKNLLTALLIAFTITLVKSQVLNHYYGNLHAHSSYSDGNKDSATSLITKPLQDFNYANASQHIDFYGIAEHNHFSAGLFYPYYYHNGLADADAATTNGSFVALYGMEWGVISGGGHVLVYGYDSLMGWDSNDYDVYVPQNNYAALWSKINKKPGSFAYLAHPNNTDFSNLYAATYSSSADSAIVGSPFRSGPAFSTNNTYTDKSTSNYSTQYNNALKQGYHIGIGLDHDTHNSVFGRQTAGRLVIMAASLTRNDLLNSMRAMRFYASDDWNAKADFTLNGKLMGSIITHSGTATLSVTTSDPDVEATSTIFLYYGVPGSGTAAALLSSNSNLSTLTYTHALANNTTYYYYAKITQADGDIIYTSPIWYTRNDAVSQYPPITSFNMSTTSACKTQAIILTSTSTNTATSWYWSMPGGTPSSSTLQNPIVTYSTAGIKNITLIATNISGSGAPLTKTVTISACTAIDELEGNHQPMFNAFPNPASTALTILFSDNKESYNLKLIDVFGKECLSKNKQSIETAIDISNVNEGIYFLQITDSKNNTYTKHIVVNRH